MKKSIVISLGIIVIVGILVVLTRSQDTREPTPTPVTPQGQQDNEETQSPPAVAPPSAIEPQKGAPPSATPQPAPTSATPKPTPESGGTPTRKIAPIDTKTITNLESQLNALSNDAGLIGETNSLLDNANKAHEKQN